MSYIECSLFHPSLSFSSYARCIILYNIDRSTMAPGAANYSPLRPFVKKLRYQSGSTPTSRPLFDLDDEENWHKPVFEMPKVENRRMDPFIENITEVFLPDALLIPL